MKLETKLREARAVDQSDVSQLESRELTVEADSFEQAVQLIEAQTPEGWVRLYLRTV